MSYGHDNYRHVTIEFALNLPCSFAAIINLQGCSVVVSMQRPAVEGDGPGFKTTQFLNIFEMFFTLHRVVLGREKNIGSTFHLIKQCNEGL